MDFKRDGVTLAQASMDDLATLSQVQLTVFGKDSPEARALVTRMHEEDMLANSGLLILKADLSDGKTVGFCKLYFPNMDAVTEAERVPIPLRPADDAVRASRASIDEYFWIEGSNRDEQADSLRYFSTQEMQTHVHGRECTYVSYMCVDPEYQRRGIGKALISLACEYLDQYKTAAYLESSRSGEGLYRKSGFEVIGHSSKDFAGGLVVDYSHMWRNAAS